LQPRAERVRKLNRAENAQRKLYRYGQAIRGLLQKNARLLHPNDRSVAGQQQAIYICRALDRFVKSQMHLP
jgi:hypothetical protein